MKWYRDFRFSFIIRVFSLTVSIFIVCLLVLKSGLLFLTVFLAIGVIYQVYEMLKVFDSILKEVITLFTYIKFDDFSQEYSIPKGSRTFEALGAAMNDVLAQFRKIKIEKEGQYQYVWRIVQQAPIGIVSYTLNGSVKIINPEARRILGKDSLLNIKEIQDFDSDFFDLLEELPLNQKRLVEFHNGRKEACEASVFIQELNQHGNTHKLLVIHNIQAEMSDKEMQAWQNLIRVLTHEIINSVTPVASLASTLEYEVEFLQSKVSKGESIPLDELDEIHLAIQTIHRRSHALIRFMQEFRSLSNPPNPILQHVSVSQLFEEVDKLMRPQIEKNGIRFEVLPPHRGLFITADPELIVQILINLIKNAMEAIDSHVLIEPKRKEGTISLIADLDVNSHPVLFVKDNGPGIEKDALKKIFIPFFTTKIKGSGIGLSLSREIMRKHKGTITAQSELGQGSMFCLHF